ncbi:inositol monophosphatase [Lentibacter algarum]|uniref:inositol monophosphatase family protein n=1 Tax=Lentibacter algarum TaxID=576131 RepID=UPI001C071D6A|nr:inositol monophosphatase [Lentibacter algarum]MBU2980882.1 inositol monophosphatase [Lentibacter algarum]
MHEFSNTEITHLTSVLRETARQEILPRFRKLDAGDILTKSGAFDLVTEADTRAEKAITAALHAAYPEALVVGEEAVAADNSIRDALPDAPLAFLVDPVDGTWNFARGLATFGTILAATHFGAPTMGLIYDPIGDDLVWANTTEQAAFQNSQGSEHTVKTASAKPLDQLSGYIHLKLMPPEKQPAIAALFPLIGQPGSLRCSAHEYRLIAQGHVDFVLSTCMTPWDHAAGVLLCQQAGGVARMLDGSAYSANLQEGPLLVASCEEVWRELHTKFAPILL